MPQSTSTVCACQLARFEEICSASQSVTCRQPSRRRCLKVLWSMCRGLEEGGGGNSTAQHSTADTVDLIIYATGGSTGASTGEPLRGPSEASFFCFCCFRVQVRFVIKYNGF